MRPLVAVLVLGPVVLAGCSSGTATRTTTAQTSTSAARVSACASQLLEPRAAPKPLRTPLPASILSSFAVFRRAAVASDQPPTHEPSGGQLADELLKEYELASYYPAYVRQLMRLPDGQRYFVVAAYARFEPVAAADCLSRGVDRRQLTEQQRRRAREPVYCLIELPADNTQGPGCEPFAAVDESARAFEASDYHAREATVEMVPDGVASVRILYRDHVPSQRGSNGSTAPGARSEGSVARAQPATPRLRSVSCARRSVADRRRERQGRARAIRPAR
jgi:hypothetical protein